jgi:hypothetical protein
MAGKRSKKRKARKEKTLPEDIPLSTPARDWKTIGHMAALIASVLLSVLFFTYLLLSDFGSKQATIQLLLVVTATITTLITLWFFALVDILANKFTGSNKTIWLPVMALSPVIGLLIYFIVGWVGVLLPVIALVHYFVKVRGQKLPQDLITECEKKVMALKVATRVLFTILFFSYLFSMSLKYPLNDPDVWWHLKSGHWIIENTDIPDDDYFSYTTPKPLIDWQIRGLRTQWLGQVVFALAEKSGGVAGVAMLRNILILLPMLILFLWLIRKGVSHYAAMGIVLLPSSLLILQLFYAFERPQAFSFLFIMLIAMLLERLRTRGPGKFDFSMVLLPVAMAVWSNLHAGFIVGNMVICIFFASEAFMYVWRKYRGSEAEGARPIFFVICVLAILASFINPNTYHIFYQYFTGLSAKFFKDFAQTVSGGGRSSWVEQVVLEFKPLRYFYETLLYKWIMVFWIFTAYPLQPYNIPIPGVLFVMLIIKYWSKKRIDLAEALTVFFIWFLANYYARMLMFSLTILPFYMGKTLMDIRFPPLNYKKIFMAVISVFIILTVGFINVTYRHYWRQVLKPRVAPSWITPWYPQLLSDFLETTKISGPMYNFYTWGGFLMWRLYPQYKVFIDGRALDQNISWTADSILKTYPEWRNQLEAFNINFIVIPVIFRESGHIIPLAPALVEEDEWKLVFLRNNSAVFVRDVPKNWEYISRFNMDKRSIFVEIVNIENVLLMGMPDNPTFHMAKADALFALGRYEEAKAIYSRFPRLATKQLEALKRRGY